MIRNFFHSVFSATARGLSSQKTQSASNPILVLGTPENYSSYIGEILRTEGFNCFQIENPDNTAVTLSYLQLFQLVILGQMSLAASQREVISSYVSQGGNLIAMRPDKKCATLFGLTDWSGTLAEGYLKINSSSTIGESLINEPLQFHGAADLYTTRQGTPIARLYSHATEPTNHPAVVSHTQGLGTAIAFTYNLPECVIGFRQGNWTKTGKKGNGDGIKGRRITDKFIDGWVDPTKNHLNQADEQMRLLSSCILTLLENILPLPRIWYFPHKRKSFIVLTNDGEDNTGTEFEEQFKAIESKGAQMTLYVLNTRGVTRNQVERWQIRGHEIAAHPDATHNADNPTWRAMNKALRSKIKAVHALGAHRISTNTNHWFVWCDLNQDKSPNIAAQAQLEYNHGIRLDCNTAHYDNGSTQGAYLGGRTYFGNFNGSGLAMKYADHSGKIIDIYGIINNVYDQLFMEANDQKGYCDCFKAILDRSLDEEVYSVVHIKAHYDEWKFTRDPIMGEGAITPGILDYANRRGIPVTTAKEFLRFVLLKDNSSFSDIAFNNQVLKFTLDVPCEGEGLTYMVPGSFGGNPLLELRKNGNAVAYTERLIKGRSYAMDTVSEKSSYSIVASYGRTNGSNPMP